MPGVTIVDMGWKMGVNGVDNAALAFENVKIPRENMLNRYSDVTPEGKFECPITKNYSRFFQVTERLVSGRLCIASISLGATRACLYTIFKFGAQRLCVGASGKSDTPIGEY